MPDLTPMLVHVIPFTLVLSRVVGIMLFAPIVSMAGVPVRARALLAFVLAVSLYPIVPPLWSEGSITDIFALLPIMGAEVLVGVVLGMLASVPLLAMEMAGQMLGHQMGLGLARAFNPAFESEMDVAGQLLFTVAAGVYLALGGLEILYLALARTFRTLPAGEIVSGAFALETYMNLARAGTDLALRVAAPVLGSLILILIAMGFLMKTMPQINILSVGFAIKIVSGILVLTWSLFVIEEAFADELQRSLQILLEWAQLAGGAHHGR